MAPWIEEPSGLQSIGSPNSWTRQRLDNNNKLMKGCSTSLAIKEMQSKSHE